VLTPQEQQCSHHDVITFPAINARGAPICCALQASLFILGELYGRQFDIKKPFSPDKTPTRTAQARENKQESANWYPFSKKEAFRKFGINIFAQHNNILRRQLVLRLRHNTIVLSFSLLQRHCWHTRSLH